MRFDVSPRMTRAAIRTRVSCAGLKQGLKQDLKHDLTLDSPRASCAAGHIRGWNAMIPMPASVTATPAISHSVGRT